MINVNFLVASIKDQVISWRRHLHQNPELSYHEGDTSQFIYNTLLTCGNLEVTRPTKTSVMAQLVGKKPGKVVAIRADMDALPVQEETTVNFASQNPGVMHACGHDAHTAMLLGVAKVFCGMQEDLTGELRFIFQHAEELFPPGGAEELVEAGVMDGVDYIIGGHVWTPLEIGKIGLTYGPMMASPDSFYLTIKGKGGHGAMPHQTIDAIVIGAEVVVNLQHIVARNIDPLDQVVVSVCRFVGGTSNNIIPNKVQIDGTIRTLNPKLREEVPLLLERIVQGITSAHGADYDLKVIKGYRQVLNDESVVRILEETVREVMGNEAIEFVRPSMGAEDFSAYLQKAKGAFFFIGGGNQEKGYIYPHHHPCFMIDEDALQNGMKIFIQAALKLLV
ncbi:amidohydrolase [Desulfosporosinus fructosivorans]|uniref:Amidohydrolase n=1 Tax=Desulfosporosinus fructosivorans TaxID=2018669 RepID=A0A4Z0R099_9FIRM|nr:amidohydrolase [Desulfosporosinus fructosivorans]TGE36160.1 amidohydrolase [Desulfosporosinus fructosivorans]